MKMIYVKAKIVNSDGSNLTATNKVYPIISFGHGLFEQVDFYLGGININQANNLYNYQAFLEELLYRHLNKADAGVMWDKEEDIKK